MEGPPPSTLLSRLDSPMPSNFSWMPVRARIPLATTAHLVYKACTEGHADILKLLISAGAAVDVTDAKGLTPLYLCCLRGQVEMASLLLDARADATRTHKGWSAFDLALRDGADAALQPLLLKHAHGLLLERQAAAGPATPVEDVGGGATAPAEAATLLERLREAARRAKTATRRCTTPLHRRNSTRRSRTPRRGSSPCSPWRSAIGSSR